MATDTKIITKKARTDPSKTMREAFEVADFKLYCDEDVLAAISQAESIPNEVHFFKVGKYVSPAQLMKEYEARGLTPVNPRALAAVHETSPGFCDRYNYTATQWKDAGGKWCYAAFYRWSSVDRRVFVYRDGDDWVGVWWFAGFRNFPSDPLNPALGHSEKNIPLGQAIELVKQAGYKIYKEI